jgi:hypothetical protein
MAIIDDFDGIAKRLRELHSAAPKSVNEIADLEKWRDAAKTAARAYVENRRKEAMGGPVPLPGRPFRHGPRS